MWPLKSKVSRERRTLLKSGQKKKNRERKGRKRAGVEWGWPWWKQISGPWSGLLAMIVPQRTFWSGPARTHNDRYRSNLSGQCKHTSLIPHWLIPDGSVFQTWKLNVYQLFRSSLDYLLISVSKGEYVQHK